jgi:dTDP-4-dehydrorhamnose reductase
MEQVAWVTGANGLIGNRITRAAPPQWRVIPLTRRDLDLSNPDAIQRRFQEDRPRLVIHCAAITSVSDCEQNSALAWQINCEATRALSQLASDIPFVFFSTDLVFDGHQGRYAEDAPANPLTVYGKTKVAAEQHVLRNPRHTVIRTSLNGGRSLHGNRSFTEQVINSWRAGRAPKLFVDEFRSPIMADVTARAVWELIGKHHAGLFHIAGAERLSRFEIGMLMAERFNELHPKLEGGSLSEFPGPPRSPDTSLDSSMAQALLSFALPRFSDWLQQNDSIEE